VRRRHLNAIGPALTRGGFTLTDDAVSKFCKFRFIRFGRRVYVGNSDKTDSSSAAAASLITTSRLEAKHREATGTDNKRRLRRNRGQKHAKQFDLGNQLENFIAELVKSGRSCSSRTLRGLLHFSSSSGQAPRPKA
jgi:hypothetical protein